MRYVTAEPYLKKSKNRFSLVHLAAQRARQLESGYASLVPEDGHKSVIVALNEILAGKITQDNINSVREHGTDEELNQDNDDNLEQNASASADLSAAIVEQQTEPAAVIGIVDAVELEAVADIKVAAEVAVDTVVNAESDDSVS
jgi:DNA-directed RNA polymerase omega subunit